MADSFVLLIGAGNQEYTVRLPETLWMTVSGPETVRRPAAYVRRRTGVNMRVYETKLLGGITRTKEFERKKLASFAVNVGTKCGHDCL